MKRIHYLAAEIFFYSYDNYDGHLGINDRFDQLMPDDAHLLDTALNGDFDPKKLAVKLKMTEDELIEYLQRAKNARKIVDADSPAGGFREGVKQSIQQALEKGIADGEAIDALALQICYRAADLGFRLKQKGERLEQYSEDLRREP
jgi:hypothetical protein|tara:strand:+ start:274 stop:711 length:438 start_codon:yes stop_codon:yes gene_type:complete